MNNRVGLTLLAITTIKTEQIFVTYQDNETETNFDQLGDPMNTYDQLAFQWK